MGIRHATAAVGSDSGDDRVSKDAWDEIHRPVHKYDATTAPTASDDSTSNYEVGSMWFDAINKLLYFCMDATEDAAVWNNIPLSGSEVSLVGSGSTYGASPNTIAKPAGTQDGDLLVWAMQATNSIPNVAGPDGGGWTQALSFDTSSNEWQVVWYKVASSEGESWSLTHSAGTDVVSAVAVFRGVDTLYNSAFVESLTTPPILGHSRGAQICVWLTTTGSVGFTNPFGITEAVNAQNPSSTNKPSVLISYRSLAAETVPAFVATGPTGTTYHGSLVMVFV